MQETPIPQTETVVSSSPPIPEPRSNQISAETTVRTQKPARSFIAIIFVIGFVLGLGVASILGYVALNRVQSNNPSGIVETENPDEMTACTMDAKVCPDGTSVGRSGPNCEFDPCPTASAPVTQNEGWKTYSKPELKLSFEYPPDWIIETNPSNPRIVTIMSPINNDAGLAFQAAYAVCVDRATEAEIPCDSSFSNTIISVRLGYAEGYQERDIVVDGIDGKFFSGKAKDSDIFVKSAYIPVGDYYFQLVMHNDDVDNIFDKVVSSLHFN